MAGLARLGKLTPSRTVLFVCDVQDRFRPIISNFPAVVDTARRMVRGATALEMPVVVTEQYPKALGHTVEELTAVLPPNTLVAEKSAFSMWVPEVSSYMQKIRATHDKVLLVGIETHVCVLQTTLDLLGEGYDVHVLVDGVSSQRDSDRAVALQRLQQSGAFLATSEMVLFQLAGSSKHPAFKTISALAKEPRPPPLTISSNL